MARSYGEWRAWPAGAGRVVAGMARSYLEWRAWPAGAGRAVAGMARSYLEWRAWHRWCGARGRGHGPLLRGAATVWVVVGAGHARDESGSVP